MQRLIRWFAAASTMALGAGCASTPDVRYVYQDGDFGVVGLPENTDIPPTHYRQKAEKLMAAHFPGGYEVVRAEEVVEGERTVKLEGSRTAELTPELPAAPTSLGKLGLTASSVQNDVVKLKECRIIYRRIGGPTKPAGYSEVPALTPTLYVDPNALERRKVYGQEPTLTLPKPKPEKSEPINPDEAP